jgi:glycosyltransferase involved in cell wall biosynthesis
MLLGAPLLVLCRFYGCRTIVQLHSPWLNEWLERYSRVLCPILKFADQLLTSSARSSEILEEHGLNARPAPVFLPGPSPTNRKLTTVQPRIVVTRSLEQHNHVGLVIRAFRLVKQKYPRAELVIVGDGPQRGDLERLVAEERINGVGFVGHVPRKEVSSFFAEADVHVNASARPDTPLSVLEAMAAGLPVLTVTGGGASELIRDRSNGLIVDAGDHIGLADRIVELVEDDALVGRLSEGAARYVDSLAWSRRRGEWLRIYNRVGGPHLGLAFSHL